VPETLTILVAGADPNLRGEFADALAGVPDASAVPHFASTPTAAAEAARAINPGLIVVDQTGDLKDLRHLVEELHAAAPGTTVAAAFRPELFGPEVSESSFFVEATRAGARDFLRRPLSSADLGQLLGRLRRPAMAKRQRTGKVVTFASNKGGVGKSTLAVSTACVLATRHPDRVLLIDASLQMGVCSVLLNLQPPTTLTDCVREWDRLDESLLRRLAVRHECGLHLLACPADAEEAAAIDDQVLSRVVTLARRTYDFVVIDTFPLLDKVILAALDLSDRSFVVVESVVPTVLGAVHLLKLFDRLGYSASRLRLVLNRYDSGLGGPRPDDVAARLGRTVDYIIPYSRKLIAAANLGEPYALRAPTWWGFGKALNLLVDDLDTMTAMASETRPADRKASR